MAHEIPCKTLKSMIKDEEKGAKEYDSFGLKALAKDERKHKRYLKKMYAKKCGRKK